MVLNMSFFINLHLGRALGYSQSRESFTLYCFLIILEARMSPKAKNQIRRSGNEVVWMLRDRTCLCAPGFKVWLREREKGWWFPCSWTLHRRWNSRNELRFCPKHFYREQLGGGSCHFRSPLSMHTSRIGWKLRLSILLVFFSACATNKLQRTSRGPTEFHPLLSLKKKILKTWRIRTHLMPKTLLCFCFSIEYSGKALSFFGVLPTIYRGDMSLLWGDEHFVWTLSLFLVPKLLTLLFLPSHGSRLLMWLLLLPKMWCILC